MYPTFLRIGSFEITSFGVLVALGALAGMFVFQRELRRSGLPADAVNAAIAGVLGGLVGAKLIWAIEFRHTAPFLDLLLSRGGLSWFGGFAGGLTAGLATLRGYGVPLVRGLAAASPGLALGHAIGRVGCFLVGDDYGQPSTLPWAVAFPKGLPPTDVPVHPTQLYEAIPLVVLAWLLIRWRRKGVADAMVLSRYLILAGAIRFAIEFVRVNAPVLGPLTLAQLWSIGLIGTGLAFSLWPLAFGQSLPGNRK
jgi:phosphatidylglycerol---prolipoprotein diacylglyceryl transferase